MSLHLLIGKQNMRNPYYHVDIQKCSMTDNDDSEEEAVVSNQEIIRSD